MHLPAGCGATGLQSQFLFRKPASLPHTVTLTQRPPHTSNNNKHTQAAAGFNSLGMRVDPTNHLMSKQLEREPRHICQIATTITNTESTIGLNTRQKAGVHFCFYLQGGCRGVSVWRAACARSCPGSCGRKL